MAAYSYDVIYVEDKRAMAQYCSWAGPVGKDTKRRLRTLEFRSKMSAGISTGKLKRSIKTVKMQGKDYLQGDVGSWTVRYARWHHQGTRPHLITPKRHGGVLRFAIRGRIVFATRVRHPGTRPNHYLTRWLREAAK